MNDFLTNLVARSFAPAPDLLRPKLPSLFEAPADGEPVLEESQSLRSPDETMTLPPAPSPLPPLPMERPRFHEPFAEPSRETREIRRTLLSTVPEQPRHATAQIQNESQTIVPPALKAETAPEARKQTIVPRVETVAQPAGEKHQPASIQESMPRLVPVIPRVASSRSIPQTENHTNTASVPLEEVVPTVRIHIGRIEVRAVTQSAPPARTIAPNRPKMTLDEYLLRRNEGKR